MNDDNALWAAIGRLRHLKERGEESVSELTLETLTALADRLDGGVIVPREPTEAMLATIREAHWESSGCQFCTEDYRAAYRAMLTASEAKYHEVEREELAKLRRLRERLMALPRIQAVPTYGMEAGFAVASSQRMIRAADIDEALKEVGSE